MKRVRDNALVDLTTGETLRGDELFSDKQRALLILAQSDFKTVASFEQSSRRARALVVDNAVWKRLFERDYAHAYASAIDPNSWRNKIDNHTIEEREGRGETYWKRYYQFMVKTGIEIDVHYKREWKKSIDKVERVPNFWTITVDDRYVVRLLPYVNTVGDTFLNPSGRRHEPTDGWKLCRKPGTNIFYFFPSSYVDWVTFSPPARGENHPNNVVYIDMNTTSHTIVPYDPEMENYDFIHYRFGNGLVYLQSIDGFEWYVFDSYDNYKLLVIIPFSLRKFLV